MQASSLLLKFGILRSICDSGRQPQEGISRHEESQYIGSGIAYAQLFGGYTPAVSLEELWYDCKLMNRAIDDDNALLLRNMLSDSDTFSSAEALVLSPTSCLHIAHAITSSTDTVQRA